METLSPPEVSRETPNLQPQGRAPQLWIQRRVYRLQHTPTESIVTVVLWGW